MSAQFMWANDIASHMGRDTPGLTKAVNSGVTTDKWDYLSVSASIAMLFRSTSLLASSLILRMINLFKCFFGAFAVFYSNISIFINVQT